MTLLADHHQILRSSFNKWNGREVDTEGDAFFVSFPRATEAVAAVVEAQRIFADHAWPQGVAVRVRMGLHTGEPWTAEEGYVGMDVHRAARIAHVGHGGQVLLSETTAALVRDDLPEGTSLLDLGRHRLKDIDQPERIRQLVIQGMPSEYPPLKSLESIDGEKYSIPNNLPAQSTPFVGRDKELADLDRLLEDPSIRLITIVGTGGMGKTRLALTFAERQLGKFEHGVFFISLAALDAVEDIVPAVARGLGFSFYEGGDHRRQLFDYLRAKSMLLLLDNFEHLLDGASLVTEIVRATSEVHVIVTSREPLRLVDEQLYSIHGLDYPDWETPEFAVSNASTRLFVESARRSRQEFELGQDDLQPLTRICRLVQGIPLGIVLAAGWVELLSPAEIAEELGQGIDILETDLRDVPQRQRSMRAVFDYTWEHLNQREREVLQRLSVFRGGCSLKAIRQVTGATFMELKSLAGKSLLSVNQEGRHEMHELLRQYAAEVLRQDPEIDFEAHDQHCEYYLDAVAALEVNLFSSRYQTTAAEIDADLNNVRLAWRWASINHQVDRLDLAMNTLFFYYIWREQTHTLYSDAELVVINLEELESPQARLVLAKSLNYQGWFLEDIVDIKLVERGIAILAGENMVPLDTRRVRALLLDHLGSIKAHSNPVQAVPLLEESLRLCRETGERWGTTEALWALASIALSTGDIDQARSYIEESLAIRRELGNPIGLANSLYDLAEIVALQGDVKEAKKLGRQQYRVRRELGDPASMARSSWALGSILCDTGSYEEAIELLEISLAGYQKLGAHSPELSIILRLAFAHLQAGNYAPSLLMSTEALAAYEPNAYTTAIGRAHFILGSVALAQGNIREAQERYHEAIAALRTSGGYMWPLCLSMPALSMALQTDGKTSYAKEMLAEILKRGIKMKAFTVLASALPAGALLVGNQEQPEHAVELYELARSHPFVANSTWYEDVAGKHIITMAESLPPEIVSAARQRGRQRDPVETAEELLAKLESEETQV